jgi:serine/threonine protein kinase
VLATGLEEGAPFFAMERLFGLTLQNFLQSARDRGAKMHPGVACAIASAIGHALGYAHAKSDRSGKPLGLVHRDVTPDNVFLTADGSVKLLDFGIARVASAVRLTRSGYVRGKVDYMLPEQLAGMEVDSRADVFALGVVLWEMLIGRHPWGPLAPERMARAIREEPALAPSAKASKLPSQLDALVMGMLAKFASGRPERMAIVTSVLDRVACDLLGGRRPELQIAAMLSAARA